MSHKFAWWYRWGALLTVYVLVVQQLLSIWFVRADEATDLFFPKEEIEQEVTDENIEEQEQEVFVDKEIESDTDDMFQIDQAWETETIDEARDEETPDEIIEEVAWTPIGENEWEENWTPTYFVELPAVVGTPEEHIEIVLPDEEIWGIEPEEKGEGSEQIGEQEASEEHLVAPEEQLPEDGMFWEEMIVQELQEQEIMFTEPDTLIAFDEVGRIDPTSLLSISVDTHSISSQIGSELARQNQQMILWAGGREELPELPKGDSFELIQQWLHDLQLTAIDPTVVEATMTTLTELTKDTIFDMYVSWSEGGQQQAHRFVVVMGTDGSLYVLDPRLWAVTDSPQLFTNYLASLTDMEEMLLYIRSEGWNPTTIEKQISVPDEVIIKQDNITVEIPQQVIHQEDQWGESQFDAIQDFVIEKLSESEFILGDSGSHLEFAQPMRVELTTDLPEWTSVPIMVKHEWDEDYSTRWLTTNPDAECVAGISSDETAVATVTQGKIMFSSCGASTFMVDLTFGIGWGFNNAVTTVALQADGKTIVWGSFTGYNNATSNRIVRLLTWWGIDTGFIVWGGFNNTVNAVAVQADGKIVVGGAFTNYSGTAQNRITRLTSTGARDTTFVIWAWCNNTVNALAIQADGKIIVGWTFTTYAWVAQSRITRLSSTGARDATFVVGTGFDNTVSALAMQVDGKIVVGGAFTNYAGTPQNRMTRLSTTGARDTTFNIGTGFNNTVSALVIETWGNIVAAGAFTNYAWTAINRIVRVTTTGARDVSYVVGSAFNNTVSTLALQTDGKIIAGGAFTNYSGTAQTRITRLSTTWARDTTLLSAWVGFNNTVASLAIQSDGRVVAWGSFTTFNGFTENRFVRFYATGARDNELVVFGFNNSVLSIWLQSDNKIVVWGSFTNFSGTSQNSITRLTSTWVLDTTFNIGSAFNNNVNAVAVQADGKIVVGGAFTSYSGTAQNRITRLTSTGARDTTFVIWAWCNNTVNAVAIQADGKIVVWWAFTTYAWVAQSRITRLSTTGARDTTFVIWAWFNGTVNSLAMQADSKIVVGWAFTTYAWVAQSRITRLTTTWARDTTFVVWTGFDNTVNALAMQADGKIVAGGAFTNYAWTPQSRITRLSATGARDTTFVGTWFNGTVLTLWIQADQKIVAGGSFTAYRGIAQNRITRISTTWERDALFVIGLWFDNTVNTLLIESPSTLLIGWLFLMFNNNVVQHGLTRLFMVLDPTIISPWSGAIVTSSTLDVVGTWQPNGVITVSLSGVVKTGTISSTWGRSVLFTGMTNGVRTMTWVVDYQWNRSDIVSRTFTISLGTIAISSQTWWSITWLQTTNTGQISERISDYFQVIDEKGAASWYYTTLGLTNMLGTGGAMITTGMIQRKGSGLTLLSWTINPQVVLSTGVTSYQFATGIVTFIKRDPSATWWILSTYGANLYLLFTLPAYQAVSTYSWTLTYTLYEN